MQKITAEFRPSSTAAFLLAFSNHNTPVQQTPASPAILSTYHARLPLPV